MLYCHCERSEAIPYLDCFVTLFLAMTLSCCHCIDQRDYLFYADTLRLAAGSFMQQGPYSLKIINHTCLLGMGFSRYSSIILAYFHYSKNSKNYLLTLLFIRL